MHAGFPMAAPIQRMSWLPQTKSTPCMSMRSSMTICAAGAAVENVADDVQLVYRQAGDEIRERHDEPVGDTGLDHAVDDAFKIPALVGIVLVGVNELLDNIGIFLRQTGAHLDAGIFVRRLPADGHKTVDRHTVPGIGVRCGGKLPLGVIEQRASEFFSSSPRRSPKLSLILS